MVEKLAAFLLKLIKSEKPQRHKAEEEMRRRETKEVERGEEGKQRNE